MARLVIENLSVAYNHSDSRSRPVLDRLNLKVEAGEILALLGESGSGKSTLLNAIAGFAPVAHGSIRLGDTDLLSLPPHRRRAAMVFQNYALFPHLSVIENVMYGLKAAGIPKNKAAEQAEALLESVGMLEAKTALPDRLSGGEQQRVALARAAVTTPGVLLLDEPLSNLDVNLRDSLRVLIRSIHMKLPEPIPAIYVTHDRTDAFLLGDRIAILHRGGIEAIGAPAVLYRHPPTRHAAEFMGACNALPVRKLDETETEYYVETPGKTLFRVPRVPGVTIPDAPEIFCRPESIHTGPAPQGVLFHLDFSVIESRYLGAYYIVDIAAREKGADGPELRWKFHSTKAWESGDTASAWVAESDFALLP